MANSGPSVNTILSSINNDIYKYKILRQQLAIKNRDSTLDNKLLAKLRKDSEGNIVHKDPILFYHSFCYPDGYLVHDRTKEKIYGLTKYQIDFWKSILDFQYNILVKSNKIGISTLVALALIQNCFLRLHAGNEKLIVAQKHDMAVQHLKTVRELLLNSPNFKKFLIVKPIDGLSKDEVSKSSVLYIRNPYKWYQPTAIHAIGLSMGSSVSWKKVDWIWVSDITAAELNYDDIIKGLFTRLAISQGKFVIETIPRRPNGIIYDLWNKAIKGENQFKWHKINCYDAIKEGIMTEEFILDEKRNHGADFSMFYEGEFVARTGNIFIPEQVENIKYVYEDLLNFKKSVISNPDLSRRFQPTDIVMGVDPGFSTSKFAITITQLVNGIIEVIYHKEYDNESITFMINEIRKLFHAYNVKKIFMDTNFAGFVDQMKKEMRDIKVDLKITQDRKLRLSDLKNIPGIILPLSFKRWGNIMISHMQLLISESKLAISEHHFDLLAQTKSATWKTNEDGVSELDKKSNGTMDGFDSLRLATAYYSIVNQ